MILLRLCIAFWLACLAVEGQFPRNNRVDADPGVAYDAVYDFRRNYVKRNPYVTEVNALQGTGCSRRGILKLALESALVDPNRRHVLVDLFFQNPKDSVFNIGDSTASQNAAGGLLGGTGSEYTQTNDAEVLGYGTTFSGNHSEVDLHHQAFSIPNLYTTRLSVIVGDGHALWIPNNNNKVNYYSNPAFFALNGQDDLKGGVNYDLYLGMNQALSGNHVGSGLCRVGIKFLTEVGGQQGARISK